MYIEKMKFGVVCVYMCVSYAGQPFPELPNLSNPVPVGSSLCLIYLLDKYFLGAYCVLSVAHFTPVSSVEPLCLDELKDVSLH